MTEVLKHLSGREAEVLSWYSAGYKTSEVASLMKISPATVGVYSRRAKIKLLAPNLKAAIVKALQIGWIVYPSDGAVPESQVNRAVRESVGLRGPKPRGTVRYKIRHAIEAQAQQKMRR